MHIVGQHIPQNRCSYITHRLYSTQSLSGCIIKRECCSSNAEIEKQHTHTHTHTQQPSGCCIAFILPELKGGTTLPTAQQPTSCKG